MVGSNTGDINGSQVLDSQVHGYNGVGGLVGFNSGNVSGGLVKSTSVTGSSSVGVYRSINNGSTLLYGSSKEQIPFSWFQYTVLNILWLRSIRQAEGLFFKILWFDFLSDSRLHPLWK